MRFLLQSPWIAIRKSDYGNLKEELRLTKARLVFVNQKLAESNIIISGHQTTISLLKKELAIATESPPVQLNKLSLALDSLTTEVAYLMKRNQS